MVALGPHLLEVPLARLVAWEAAATDATGLDTAFLRYVISFFLSVLVGWGWRYMPSPRGE